MSGTTRKALQERIVDPEFLQWMAKKLLIGFGASLLANLLSWAVIFVMATHPPREHFFYLDDLLRPRELLATDKPYYTDSEIGRWATETVCDLYTMNFKDIDKHIDKASGNFDIPGWNSWLARFKERGNIDYIKSERIYLTAVPRHAYTIMDSGIDPKDHLYTWKVRFHMLWKWENSHSDADHPQEIVLRVDVTIKKTNNPIYKGGIAITELNAPRLSDVGGG